MKQYVLTINRQFASMGRSIAAQTAERLGVKFYDRDIVEEAAKRTNLSLSEASEEEETARSSITRKLFPLGQGTTELQDEIFAVQESIIQDLADAGSCIIVGRCSDHILRHHPNQLRVYICAPFEARIRNCIESLHMHEKEARRMCVEIDRARENYHLRYAGYSAADPVHSDLIINSDTFGIDGTADLLADMVRRRFGD